MAASVTTVGTFQTQAIVTWGSGSAPSWSGADIGKLAEELGVSRGALYLWKRKAQGLLSYRDAARQGHPAAADDPQAKKVRELEATVASLEGELGRRSLEASFFKSALRRVEGLHRQSGEPGGTASTTKSAAGSRKAN